MAKRFKSEANDVNENYEDFGRSFSLLSLEREGCCKAKVVITGSQRDHNKYIILIFYSNDIGSCLVQVYNI